MNNPFAQIVLQILEQAEERGFLYPLRATVEAADGAKQVYEFPAKGETPTLIESTLDPETGIFHPPITLTARDSTPDEPKALRFEIALEIADEDESQASSLRRGRSTKALIRELDEESFFHNVVMLVVGFENSTIFVKSTDPQRLKVLNDAVRVGGNPIGLIVADGEGGHLTISRKIFPENVEQAQQCEAYFDKLIGELGEMLKAEIENRPRQPEGEEG